MSTAATNNNNSSLSSDQQPLVRSHQQETDDYGAFTTTHDEPNDDDENLLPAALLTRRLRALFAILTWPILPLGILTLLALLWFLYAEVLDFHRHCAQPLQPYALVTVLWLLYLACAHSPVRERLAQWVGASLQATNEASLGPPRPPVVRRYDQLVQTVCLLYVYAGMTLVQTCRNLDSINNENMNSNNTTMEYNDTTDVMTCDATCPNLFPALAIYVTVLQVFTLSLIFPLLFLPCIYLWFLRHVTVHHAHYEDGDNDDLLASLRNELLDTTQPTVQEVLQDALQDVKLVQMAAEENAATDENELRAVPTKRDSTVTNTSYPTGGVRECCICMNEFVVQQCHDVEMGDTSDDNTDHEAIVRTLPCGHLFHRKCMTNWVRGGFQQQQQHQADWRRRRARRTSCPLCRTELCQST